MLGKQTQANHGKAKYLLLSQQSRQSHIPQMHATAANDTRSLDVMLFHVHMTNNQEKKLKEPAIR